MTERRLVPLGEGAYSVAEVCRILGSSMTPRKVHYWLDTGLISGQPISRGRRGVPTVLTFRQLLEIRTVQHLRDTIKVSLREVRRAFEWILRNLFDEREYIQFGRGPDGTLTAKLRSGEEITVPGGQGLLPVRIEQLTESVTVTLMAWGSHVLPVDNHPHVITSTRVLGGAPVVRNSRVDTSILAGFLREGRAFDDSVIEEIRTTFPRLNREAIEDALGFEGAQRLAG